MFIRDYTSFLHMCTHLHLHEFRCWQQLFHKKDSEITSLPHLQNLAPNTTHPAFPAALLLVEHSSIPLIPQFRLHYQSPNYHVYWCIPSFLLAIRFKTCPHETNLVIRPIILPHVQTKIIPMMNHSHHLFRTLNY